MQSVKSRTYWAVVASAALLSACGGSAIAPAPPVATSGPTNNNIVATPSTTSAIQAVLGSSTAFTVTFTTDDGQTATNLTITTGLSALPAGWTGPTSFSCVSVSTGSGCMLNLSYQPTAVDSGSVTVNYSYTNNAGTNKTGTATVSYAATSVDNVVAAPSLAGQIAVVTGGTSTVGVTFTTDDGQVATALAGDVASLPVGWSAPAGSFSCATVSTGSGCMLNLTYAPSAIGSGTLVLNYTYQDNSGTAKTGSINIPYIATTQNNVVATPTPAGQIAAVIGGSQTVKIDFTTDDATPVTSLSVTPANLTSLTAGWTGPATFTCATVSTGNGCELSLAYTPTQTGSGTVTLNFGYTNNSGVAKTGSVNIAYVATSDNTVVGTASPSGTVNAVVGQGSQPATVTFNSNDGNPGSSLAITSGLSSLPAGWSGPGTFTCTSVNTGNGCQLSLTYAPLAADSGTLQLNYSYNANSGSAKTGSVMIAYGATTQNNVVVTPSPSGSISAVVNSDSKPVTLTFTTDDGNPASTIAITSGLGGALPAGWSAPATFTCLAASTGTGCQLTLTYAPSVNGSGTVSLGYSYNDNSGAAKTGTANIAYASVPGFLYLTDVTSQVFRCAVSGTDGGLSACASAASGFSSPSGIAFSGNWAYVTPGATATDVDVCAVAADGSLSGCASASTFTTPTAVAVSGGRLYVTDANGPGLAYSCDINNADGSLSGCVTTAIGAVDTLDGIAVTATTAYMVDFVGENLSTCSVSPTDGSLSACTQTTLVGTTVDNTAGNTGPRSAAVHGGNLYLGTGGAVLVLPIAVDGSVTPTYPCSATAGTSCTIVTTPPQSPANGVAFNNGFAYVTGFGGSGGIAVCTLDGSGLLATCTNSTDPGALGFFGGLAVH
jgi:hypothetical protein